MIRTKKELLTHLSNQITRIILTQVILAFYLNVLIIITVIVLFQVQLTLKGNLILRLLEIERLII